MSLLRRRVTLFALLALGLNGCKGRGPEPLSLVLISPHRDEIRAEVGPAFEQWFAARATTRHAVARSTLQAWLDRPDAERLALADRACRQFVRDWPAGELGDVPALLASWQEQPTAARGQVLLLALTGWAGHLRPVQLVWQDVGGGTSQIARYVGARFEGSPQGIGIDLLFGGGTDIYVRFANEGLLHPLPEVVDEIQGRIPAELNGVPLYDPKGRWFGPMLSSFGILCNREVLQRTGKPEPRTWNDLGRAELRGWVNAGDPRLTGSIHMVYEIILQGEGWDDGFRLLLRLGANTHTFIRDSGTLTRSVILGEVAAAGNVDANALSAVGRDPDMMTFVLPDVREARNAQGKLIRSGGTIINPDAIAVLKGAPHLELARAFVEFTLSDAGQRLFLLRPGQPGGPQQYPLCRLSVVESLYHQFPPETRSVGAANPFAQKNVLPYDTQRGQRRWDALNDLIGATLVDVHPELAAAWRAVCESKLPDERRRELEAELFQPSCTEAELDRHARRIVEDGPRARVAQINQWGEEARQRYRRVAQAAKGPS